MVAKSLKANEKRRPGGQPGNLNAARSNVPALRRLMRGKELPPEIARIAALADDEADEIAADKGGLDNMTAMERSVLSTWKAARQCTLIILHELIERGAVRADESGAWDLQPGLQRLGVFLQQQRASLAALGLERRERNVMTLEQYLERNYGEERQ